ncbi:MAG: hypothetical protein ACI4EX_07020 [Lachnospiraceae bacterium]
MRRVIRILHGWFYWHIFCLLNGITKKSVILILCGENFTLDKYSVEYFDLFIKRKNADTALITWTDPMTKECLNRSNLQKDKVRIKYLSEKHVKLLYDFYSFDKFFDNIVFTYTTTPEENLLGKVLKETEINERDAVCLALFHLRYVPERGN